MQAIIKQSAAALLVIMAAACGSSSVKEQKGDITDKKVALQKLKDEQNKLNEKIAKLETDITAADTSSNAGAVLKLVGVQPLTTQKFVHYIDLQARVDADNISFITPRLGGGQVKAMYVKEGDFVKKGQLLLKMDDAIARQQVNAAKQSLETIKTQLAYAKDIYNRQNNLWKQDIGTEVQLINARNNVATLETQLRASEENVKTIQEQLSASNVYSDVSGVADVVNVKVGEIFTGMGQIKIVNTSSLKAVTDIPENYASKVKVGSPVVVNLPDIGKTYNSSISLASRTVNLNNRSFVAEAKLPYDGNARPNQVAQIQIRDYEAANAVVIPVNTMQTDDKGKYVYIAVKEGDNLVARKRPIVPGELYKDKLEVRSGLNAGDQLITEGYQTVYDGQRLRMDVK